VYGRTGLPVTWHQRASCHVFDKTGLDEGGHGVVELEQGLHVYGRTGLPVT